MHPYGGPYASVGVHLGGGGVVPGDGHYLSPLLKGASGKIGSVVAGVRNLYLLGEWLV